MIHKMPDITPNMLLRAWKGESVDLIPSLKGHALIIPKGNGFLGQAKYYYQVCVN